ncbi:hypothetical protein [Rhodococcus globerulus]|uniref:Uncharacterized protein n=1 Tax=Rhodococcus globerulus TaxID=33008 RepID=A0ABU4C557_RHOGO|nr:hypothetical protein [Rhodococcus globerulus]MDV6271651.1 hypothetical protein [Rhodococcus globerulus]
MNRAATFWLLLAGDIPLPAVALLLVGAAFLVISKSKLMFARS